MMMLMMLMMILMILFTCPTKVHANRSPHQGFKDIASCRHPNISENIPGCCDKCRATKKGKEW